MAEQLREYHRADYYVVREIFINIDGDGRENVVIDVQGVRVDGSYWVSGFQIVIPKDMWDSMSEEDIKILIAGEVEKHERNLNEYFNKMTQAEMETNSLRSREKYQKILNYRVDVVRQENV